MQILFGNFSLIFGTTYYFIRLLNLQISKKKWVIGIFFTLIFSVISVPIERKFPDIMIFSTLIGLTVFLSRWLKVRMDMAIPVTIISYSISYIFFAWSVTITAITMGSVIFLLGKQNNYIILQFISLVVMLFILPLPFRIKRLKNGMPFLWNERNSIIGMSIGLLVLFCAHILDMGGYGYEKLFLILIVYICAILVYIYWRKNINRVYLDKLQERNMEELNVLIEKQQQEIEALEEENKQLAKIVHKDNKLIPAMEYAVKCYLNQTTDDLENEIGKNLILELETISKERKNIINVQDKQCQKLMTTKVMRIDHLLQYMQQKAMEQDIVLNMMLACDLPKLVKHIITEDELNTLLADLIENALIATKYNQQKQVLINFSMVSNAYAVNIFDCGIPFEKEVLLRFGVKQITTHADDSGSGIGLMTTYQIIQKYQASIIIEEFNSNTSGFTKEISIVFNGLSQFILKTERSESEIAYLKERKDLQIIRK